MGGVWPRGPEAPPPHSHTAQLSFQGAGLHWLPLRILYRRPRYFVRFLRERKARRPGAARRHLLSSRGPARPKRAWRPWPRRSAARGRLCPRWWLALPRPRSAAQRLSRLCGPPDPPQVAGGILSPLPCVALWGAGGRLRCVPPAEEGSGARCWLGPEPHASCLMLQWPHRPPSEAVAMVPISRPGCSAAGLSASL